MRHPPRSARLANALALDRLLTTTETTVRRRRRLFGELAKIGLEWYLSEIDAAVGGRGKGKAHRRWSALVAPIHHTTQEEAERLLYEPAERCTPASFRHWRDDSDDDNDAAADDTICSNVL